MAGDHRLGEQIDPELTKLLSQLIKYPSEDLTSSSFILPTCAGELTDPDQDEDDDHDPTGHDAASLRHLTVGPNSGGL